jgi:O-antigen ligase
MKPVKFVLLACAALTFLVAFALPYIDVGHGIDFTLWKLRNVNPEESLVHPYIILGAMALPLVFAGLALKKQALPRWQSIVSLLCFAIALFIAFAVFTKTQTKFGEHGGIGAKLMVVALLGGLGASIAGTVKPERA